MSNIAIRAENLSKLYRVGQFVGYTTLREGLMNVMSAPFRRFRSAIDDPRRQPRNPDSQYIWALKDVSFEVKHGEAIGIIGRNGAGKTTLLKILCRITTPTDGYAEIQGRVGSLLEVGTGFHPELTGRENIYLNGAVLGMKKKEIDRKFDEIVDFAGEVVENFIDTPLKRYSSGMQVRLAFAVAAHLEPDILLVDEVLAVGDAEFQKKCLAKMGDVAEGGRTVLFVSHNMAAIKRLCHRTILLDQGKILEDGETQKVVQHYLGTGLDTSAERKWGDVKTAPGDDVVRLHAVRAKNDKGEVTAEFNIQEPIYVELEFQVLQEGWILEDSFYFYDEAGLLMFLSINNLDPIWRNRKRPVGLYHSVCRIPSNFLNEGTVVIQAGVSTHPSPLHATERDAISFQVFDPGSGGVRGDYTREWPGAVIRPLLQWKTEYTNVVSSL